jgi:plasmid stabilization system protein ParE
MPEAAADLRESLTWYEGIHADLGMRFALAVDATVEVIAQSPLRFRIVHGEIRRAGVKRFPYGLFFKLESHRIVVIACMHGRRNPWRWKLRQD